MTTAQRDRLEWLTKTSSNLTVMLKDISGKSKIIIGAVDGHTTTMPYDFSLAIEYRKVTEAYLAKLAQEIMAIHTANAMDLGDET